MRALQHTASFPSINGNLIYSRCMSHCWALKNTVHTCISNSNHASIPSVTLSENKTKNVAATAVKLFKLVF